MDMFTGDFVGVFVERYVGNDVGKYVGCKVGFVVVRPMVGAREFCSVGSSVGSEEDVGKTTETTDDDTVSSEVAPTSTATLTNVAVNEPSWCRRERG